MTQREKYVAVFCDALGVTGEQAARLEYKQIPAWDSVGHMVLVEKIEEAFGIMLETEDIMAWKSFDKGIEILKKYQIEIL